MNKIWNQVAQNVADFAKVHGFKTKVEFSGEMGGYKFYNYFMLATTDEVESLYDYLGSMNE